MKTRKISKKRFNLQSIVIGLAILGILTAVAVPKFSQMKKDAKMRGVETNLRTVEQYTQLAIADYSASEASLFETELAKSFGNKDITNPFSKAGGTSKFANIPTPGTAVSYDDSENTDKTAVTNKWEQATPVDALKGAVMVAAYPNPNGTDTLEISIYPFDDKGNAVLSKAIVVTP